MRQAVLNSGRQNLIYTYSFIVRPKIKSQSPSTVPVSVGNTLLLKCQAEGVPKPLVTWSKDGEVLQSRTSDTNFVHDNATKDVIGNYECNASNSAGSDSYRTEVIIKEVIIKEVIIKGNNLKGQHTVSSLIKPHNLVSLAYNLQDLKKSSSKENVFMINVFDEFCKK